MELLHWYGNTIGRYCHNNRANCNPKSCLCETVALFVIYPLYYQLPPLSSNKRVSSTLVCLSQLFQPIHVQRTCPAIGLDPHYGPARHLVTCTWHSQSLWSHYVWKPIQFKLAWLSHTHTVFHICSISFTTTNAITFIKSFCNIFHNKIDIQFDVDLRTHFSQWTFIVDLIKLGSKLSHGTFRLLTFCVFRIWIRENVLLNHIKTIFKCHYILCIYAFIPNGSYD